MIVPRVLRLHRAPDLRTFQRAIAEIVDALPADQVRASAVIVPTRAAALELARTLETLLLRPPARRTLVLPELVTRAEWYSRLAGRSLGAPVLVDELERHVLVRAAARDVVDAGCSPPFAVRPRLAGHLIAFYDALRRSGRRVDEFEQVLVAELEPAAEMDRGAARLLQQTRFLVALFRAYEGRLARANRVDEHGLREWLLSSGVDVGVRRVVVTVADMVADPMGLWPADFQLLARLPGVLEIHVIATEAVLAAGWAERLRRELPGIEEHPRSAAAAEGPILIAPPGDTADPLYHRYRDREEELLAVARSLKARSVSHAQGCLLDERVGVVFRRPLPYLYLARQVFQAAGVPYEALDALPLAVEPYAAALDLVLAAVDSGFARRALVALLRSPHFRFVVGHRLLDSSDIAALDRALLEARYLGDREHLLRLVAAWASGGAPASDDEAGRRGRAALAVWRLLSDLAPLGTTRPASQHLDDLQRFLRAYERLPDGDDPARERHLRARAAVLGGIERLRDAHRALDDHPCRFGDLAATLRRWIEAQTFAVRTGGGNVQLTDVHAARYGAFAEVWLVGLVEGDWPERRPPTVFYPASLLRSLGWPDERDLRRAARAVFSDLLRLPTNRLIVSVFSLEDDAVVAPSVWLDELTTSGLAVRREEIAAPLSVTPDEALSEQVDVSALIDPQAAAWLRLRAGRSRADEQIFHGFIGPQAPTAYAVSAIERYLECPFKYFAGRLLNLPEEFDDETSLDPKARGRFVHELFRYFFERWQASGRKAITFETMGLALEEFAHLVDERIETLPEADRLVERARLLGSAAAPGLAERVFRLEAERPDRIVERWLEHEIVGEFEFATGETRRRVAVRGVVDRVDLLEGGRFRVIDYKSGRAPEASRAVQLPVYGVCLATQLAGRDGLTWQLVDAGYLAFRGKRGFVPLASRRSLETALREGIERFLGAVTAIEAGTFPPRPVDTSLCRTCPYPTVCRKDYVPDEP